MIDPQDFQDAEPDLLSNHASDIIKRVKENSDQCTMALRSLCSRKKGLTVEVCFCSVMLYSASILLSGLLCMMNRIILTINWTLELHYHTIPEIYSWKNKDSSKIRSLKFNPGDVCELAYELSCFTWNLILVICMNLHLVELSYFTWNLILVICVNLHLVQYLKLIILIYKKLCFAYKLNTSV